jgi:cytidylate kinase
MKNAPFIYFISGASGVGKTTLVSQLDGKYGSRPDWLFLHFESIGVPSVEEMKSTCGSVENWQRKTTQVWIERMLNEFQSKSVIVFEGQVSLHFVEQGFAAQNFSDYKIVLVDCSEKNMNHRLSKERMQPELVTDEMFNWRAVLREQALELHVDIIDTNVLGKEQSVVAFEEILKGDKLI